MPISCSTSSVSDGLEEASKEDYSNLLDNGAAVAATTEDRGCRLSKEITS